jgi:hypothetical protein
MGVELPDRPASGGGRVTRPSARTVGAWTLTGTAVLLVLGALTFPDELARLHVASFIRIPVEALVYLAVVLLIPIRFRVLRNVLAGVTGVVLALTVILRLLDMGFIAALNRPFDAVIDWTYTRDLIELVRDSFGKGLGPLLLLAAALLAVGLLVLLPLAVLRLTRLTVRNRGAGLRAVAALAALWLVLALLDVRGDNGDVASRDTSGYLYGQVSRIPSVLRDQRQFRTAAQRDSLRQFRAKDLVSGLRGKDVLFVFVESYGKVAVQGSSLSQGVADVLATSQRDLDTAGFHSRSAWLTSPTFGAISWLAHSTFQSGLWVDSQQRYDVLVTSRRQTLSQVFGKAGWRTVADVPANNRAWPQGAFYQYDHIYDSRNVGYRGPRFGYPTMPDQYTLDAFHRLELARKGRKPVMAEIDLITSHAPWSRTPRMIDQTRVGDGSVYDGMPEQLPSERDIWPSPARVKKAYGDSIEYSLDALTTFIKSYADDNTVLVFLGDHQPATIVSGDDASHDVPVAIVAHDQKVIGRISGWGWDPGIHPSPEAPVWRMDAFRDKFLSAYGSVRLSSARAASSP